MKIHKMLLSAATTLLIILLCAMLLPTETKAATEGYYTYEVTDGEATITDCDTAISGDIAIPSTLGGHPVTGINGGAFAYCSGLTSITIPDSIACVGIWWSPGCSSLTSITIPDSVTNIGGWAFSECSSLTSITIPDGVVSIGEYAFYHCRSLTSITIPDGVTSIGDSTFEFCNSLTSITIPGDIISIGNYAFSGCSSLTSITIPDSVTSIGSAVFSDCSSLTSITIPDGITSIGEYAFYGCSSLQSITIPDSVTSIGYYSFSACSSLNSITIPDRVTSIGEGSFDGCSSLISINIPNGLTSIGNSAFQYCSSLQSITIPDSVTSIGSWTFGRCSNLTSIILPDSLISIDDFAFAWCSSLTGISIPVSVANMGSFTFFRCSSLTSITIPNSVSSIGSAMFCGCSSLNSINIPEGVSSIGDEVFVECDSLKSVIYCGTQDQWNAVTVGWGNDDLAAAALQFHDYQNGVCAVCGESGSTAPVEKLTAPKLTKDGNAIRWNAVTNATSYEIYRATSKSGKYSKVATVTETTWTDSVTAGKTYYYKVKAIYAPDTSKNSGYSSYVSIAYKCDAPVISVENGSSGKPTITWEKVSGAKKYTVYRATSETGKYKKLGTTKSLGYTDSKASAGATYFYKVIANASKSTYNSSYSNTVSCGVICGTPSVTIKIDAATGKPSLSWKKVDAAVKYRILRKLPGEEDFAVISEQTAVTFKDTTAPIDTNCVYKVQVLGKTEALNGNPSKEMTATSGIAQPKLQSGINAQGKPSVTWAAIEGAVKYEVYRSTKSTKSYSCVATIEDGTAYVDETVSAGKTYYYKVVAIGAVSKSAESSYVKLTGKCATPELFAENADSGKPYLKWYKVTGAKKYTVYRATSENGKYKKLGTTTKIEYIDTEAASGTVYFYKIVANASSSKYSSSYSNIVSCGTYCGVPAVKYSNNSAGEPVVSWSKVTGAVKYKVMYMDVTDYVGSVMGPDFENDHQVAYTTKTSFTIPDTEPGRMYMISIVAVAAKEEYSSQPSETKIVDAICATPKVTGKVGANKKPVLTWNQVDGAAQYIVLRSTSKSKGYQVVGELEKVTSFEDLNAKKGKTYYYKVIAVGYDGTESAESTYVKVKSK